ncbi:MAG: hypothetical protein IJH94_02125 [Clostridia bacterium]|nr:hypothetical protein [Clostridia bacterium]
MPTVAPTATPTSVPVTVDKGFKLEYNKEASTATTRVIDVYMVGIETFFTSEMQFDVPSDVTKAKCTFDIKQDVNGDTLACGGRLFDGSVFYKMTANDYVELDGTTKVGTIILTVNEGTSDFDVILSDEEIHDWGDVNVTEGVDLSKTRITITDPTTPEPDGIIVHIGADTVKLESEHEMSGTVIIGVYDSRNTLVRAELKKAEREISTEALQLGEHAKVFLWKLDEMCPICDAISVQ